MRHDDLADVNCSVARTWAVVGERWTMLVLRELFRGRRRFEVIQDQLGLGRSVLTDRLRTLVEHGVVVREPYQDSPRRHEYRLTPKGEDLYPLLVAMIRWGDRWSTDGDPPVVLEHRGCGHEVDLRLACPACDRDLGRRDVTAVFAPDAW
ncbi:winged helix-turn-helix transcriptional regulator [Nocardioides litoris]|uniref:winged helix-turn-helix transcriptional regulator n=1 Tax=Nocardioides litoris TaxID=1926648 RepID=UPI001124470B|nr:helix-turn-helix domain-containing protein [Nocardioides litoris]